MTTEDKIIKEVDLRWENWKEDPEFWKKDIKDFLRNALQQQKDELLERIEKNKFDVLHGYNHKEVVEVDKLIKQTNKDKCEHLITRSVQEKGKTIGFKCAGCGVIITMADAFPHIKRKNYIPKKS